MSDIELVIKIDDEFNKNAKSINWAVMRPELVDDWEYIVAHGTPLDSIIADIEAARDKDKIAEYPYNRCINIIKKAVGDES